MLNDRQQLHALIEQAHTELLRIGRFLVDDGCIELCNLINEVSEIQRSSLIEEFGTAFAGFCSQIGRLAGAMSTLGKIGGLACEVAKRNRDENSPKLSDFALQMNVSTESFEHVQQLRFHMEAYVQEFNRLGAELQWLCEKDLQFIVCDAHVLNDHPELVHADALRMRFLSSTGHLETLLDKWWRLAENAKTKAVAYETALAAHFSTHKIH